MVRLTDRPGMTLDVYRGRKTTTTTTTWQKKMEVYSYSLKWLVTVTHKILTYMYTVASAASFSETFSSNSQKAVHQDVRENEFIASPTRKRERTGYPLLQHTPVIQSNNTPVKVTTRATTQQHQHTGTQSNNSPRATTHSSNTPVIQPEQQQHQLSIAKTHRLSTGLQQHTG